ncbi:trypsin [Anabrus simplex]|uniref:trypsin n=1 Tax=Anabrus simplex TaxID=316456 RepID=UPI0035A3B1FE
MGSLKFAVEFYTLWLLQACVAEGRTFRRNGERIIGGRDALPGEFPYQVSLGSKNAETNLYEHFCGASILDKHHMLTAAHCGLYMMRGEWLAVAGALNVSDPSESTRVELPIAQIYAHDDFNLFLLQNDICLIRVKGEFPLDGSAISTIPIRNNSLIPAGECTVTGWGQTSSESALAEILQELDQSLISYEDCAKFYEDFYNHILPGMLCSGVLGGRTPCHGDSGGPLVCEGELTGIVSWSGDCTFGNYPEVYADVAYFNNWIRETLAKSYEDSSLDFH